MGNKKEKRKTLNLQSKTKILQIKEMRQNSLTQNLNQENTRFIQGHKLQ